MATFKGALVSPKAGTGGSEEGDIAGAADPHGLLVLVPDLIIPDEPLNDLSHDDCFVLADELAIEFALAVFYAPVDRDFEAGDGMAVGRSRADRRQGREAGLSGRL